MLVGHPAKSHLRLTPFLLLRHFLNRRMSIEGNESSIYEANELNQYTSIADGANNFEPQFDPAGNQTLVKTSTGIWHITYNAENRPTLFTSDDGSTIVECTYDHMGRRATKKVTTNGEVTLYRRYIYRGYLQIAACDLTRTTSPALWLILWDPTQPTATRPLAIRKDGVWYAYGWDLTKNICEIYGQTGYIRTLYTYTPYGSVTEEGDISQPIQWSSEFNDTELGLVYYNYRYFNQFAGRWIRRDPSTKKVFLNLYTFEFSPIKYSDTLGLFVIRVETEGLGHVGLDINNEHWDFGRYIGAYMHCRPYAEWRVKGTYPPIPCLTVQYHRESGIKGPLILRKGKEKSNEEKYEFKVSPRFERDMYNYILLFIFCNGQEISKMDPKITKKLKGNGLYEKNINNENMRYLGSDWSVLNNCATRSINVILSAAERATRSFDLSYVREGIHVRDVFSMAMKNISPIGIKSFLKNLESKGLVKKIR